MITRQAAEILGISVRGVQQLIKRGQLPAEKLGRDWIIPADAVRAYAASRRRGRPKVDVFERVR